MSFFRRTRDFLAVSLLHWLYRCLSATYRYEHVRRPQAGPAVYAHWHGDELLLLGAYRGEGMAVMASRSRDGDLMRRLLERLGFFVVRGSSTRGGAGGLKGLIDAAVGGREASLAVDGPRGPIYEVKPGILKLAQESGLPLIPGASAAGRRFVFKRAWNRCYLPLPFAKCLIVYGDPLTVPRDAAPEAFEAFRLSLQLTLRRLKAEAESRFQRTDGSLISEMTGCSAGG